MQTQELVALAESIETIVIDDFNTTEELELELVADEDEYSHVPVNHLHFKQNAFDWIDAYSRHL